MRIMDNASDVFSKLNIPAEELSRIAEAAKSNPLAAMGMLQECLTPEMLQELVALFMSNPEALSEAAAQAGVSPEELAEMREQMGNS
jgi:crotonobetainyl-CoA:carnitine CoA-transferase CaiB-like acyl-CoA transferase